jgi:hypothetical protein
MANACTFTSVVDLFLCLLLGFDLDYSSVFPPVTMAEWGEKKEAYIPLWRQAIDGTSDWFDMLTAAK